MTLALLITAVGGAWAQSSLNVEEFDVPAAWKGDESNLTAGDLPGFKAVTEDEVNAWTGAPTEGYAVLFYAFDGEGNAYYVSFDNGAPLSAHSPFEKNLIFGYSNSNVKIYYTASDTIELKPDADKKVWTLAKMPASNIELQVEYFAESNLFLSKEALADKTNIAVKAGDLGVQFGNDGKSANTVTEGSPMTVTYNGTKKLLGMKVAKKGAGPLAAAFKDGAKIKVGYQWNNGRHTTYLEFTNSGGTYSLTSVSGNNEANGFNSSTLTVKDSNVLALDVVCNPGGRSKMDEYSAQIEFDATSSTYKYSSKGSYFTGIISVSVNDTDITSQLTEAN